ncbi:hypothetical protein ACFOG5_24460 [Pedobacter fastidiosus]|uniref:hypothetical protein n=1 Tax=Pedobacter fastidiosus TaxID=2765361 RepID=UPI0036094156
MGRMFHQASCKSTFKNGTEYFQYHSMPRQWHNTQARHLGKQTKRSGKACAAQMVKTASTPPGQV